MSKHVDYTEWIEWLGLSTHSHQLERRKQTHPTHFKQEGDKWMITFEYATYLANCHDMSEKANKLKGGNNE